MNRERAFVTLGSPMILSVYMMAVNSDMTININNMKHFKSVHRGKITERKCNYMIVAVVSKATVP